MTSHSPFLVGIDLGTTNSAVAFVDTRDPRGRVELFQVPQLTELGVVESRPGLPSFLYFPEPHEIDNQSVALPWNPSPDAVAGVLARERGAVAPARVVSSAKSWLAHPGVDRRAAILPWGSVGAGPAAHHPGLGESGTSGPRVSPVDASARYLMHIRDAWNATIAAKGGAGDRLRLEQQRLVLTVPASFDEEARELTVEAARAAGFAQLTLIEEPIAAFYAWMADHERAAALERDRLALVCDVGGGTTDFSLIRARLDAGAPAFERVAIGEHLLLGGDNVDLALATLVERRILESRPDTRLAITQRAALRRSCAAAKERMLGDAPPDRIAITVLGAGRSVIGGAMTADLSREDVLGTLQEFLPVTPPGELAAPRDRRAGLRELGLPYETDPAITRHLAAFLSRTGARPDLVLFNGGFFTPAIARERIVQALEAWLGEAPEVMTNRDLAGAVALGAATYARLKAGVGRPLALVKAGSARTYYVGLRDTRNDDATAALCVLPRGADEGTQTRIDRVFMVATNQPISFTLYSSALRTDRPGDIVSLRPGEDAHEHAPLVTVLRYGKKSRQPELPVRLTVAFTEVGTLELWCESQASDHRWRLQFELRGREETATPDAAQSVIADEALARCEQAIRAVFSGSGGEVTAENLVAVLEQITGYAKTAWPLPVIRAFADVLIEVVEARRRSPPLEVRWLNLFGFCLRPGFGAAKDPWRVGAARQVYAAGLAFPSATQNRVEWIVLWQRAAGGFSAGQQRELALRTMGELGLSGKKGSRLNAQVERESWRLLASLERLDAQTRVRAGDALLPRLRRDAADASLLWAMGRLGARTPLYGPLSSVIPADVAGRWIELLGSLKRVTPDLAAAIVQIGARTGDSLRDVDADVLERARARLTEAGIEADALRALDEVVETTPADASRVFGEPLPSGLRLES